jgi:hypothetical protein
MDVPRFSGEEDEFGNWWVRAQTYAAIYGFQATMIGKAEGNLPAKVGPGANQGEIEAVDRNNQAAWFLTDAMPDSMLMSVVAAGQSDLDWPNHTKAHLMIAYLKWRFNVEEDVDVDEDVDVEEEKDNEEEDDDEFICVFDEEEEEDDDAFIERLANTVGVKYSDVVRCANEETGSKEDNEVKEDEADEVFIERLSNMVDLVDLLDARESVESMSVESVSVESVSVESEARESESVEDLSGVNIRRSRNGGTNEALQLNEALELHKPALELHDHNEMSKRVKNSDDEHTYFLFDRGRVADSVIEQQQQVEPQQARESAGIEEKWQSGRCRFEMQVCDSGWALAAARCSMTMTAAR